MHKHCHNDTHNSQAYTYSTRTRGIKGLLSVMSPVQCTKKVSSL